MDPTRKILSIQSHVVHGYVGNKAATFPLQYRGWDVDALNTVQFSNHPGYKSFEGFRSDGKTMHEIIQHGLINGLEINYEVILTGYMPDVSTLSDISSLIGNLCEKSGIKWILDPVLGDNGKLYVDMDCVTMYKEILTKNKIYLTTPNQFEMETVTGIKIEDNDTLKQSFLKFSELYPLVQRIVVSSIEFSNENTKDTYFVAFTDFTTDKKVYSIKTQKIYAHFSGSGDLFAALLIDMLFSKNHISFPQAIGKSLWMTRQVLKKTYDLTMPQLITDSANKPRINDLKLIQCSDIFAIPTEDVHDLSSSDLLTIG